MRASAVIGSPLFAILGGEELKLLDADIDRHQLSSSALLDPVAGVRVAYDLARFLVDVILSFALIGVFDPTTGFHIDANLPG